jgi:diphosphomevalonate decarboxylase
VTLVTARAPAACAGQPLLDARSLAAPAPRSLNSSVSCTLSQDDLAATTTVILSPAFTADALWLNASPAPLNERVQAVLRALRARARGRALSSPGGGAASAAEAAAWRVRIISRNTFPTAAGLASSAAGYACLVSALADALGVADDTTALSAVARQGSGSASRSMFGGFVRWQAGAAADGSDSVAVQVAVSTSHSLTVLSQLAVASCVPSGL